MKTKIYKKVCSKCSKVIETLNEKQVIYLMKQHQLKHEIDEMGKVK